MSKKMDRRGFFSALAQIAGVAVVAPSFLNSVLGRTAMAQTKRGAKPAAGGALPLVDPKDAVAKAVKYVEDYRTVPQAKAGNQDCGNCGFYTKKEVRNGKEVGTCTIFAGKVVLKEGWCASWNKKA